MGKPPQVGVGWVRWTRSAGGRCCQTRSVTGCGQLGEKPPLRSGTLCRDWYHYRCRTRPLLQETLADGCHLTRDTLAAIGAAGFDIEGGEATSGTGLRLEVAGMGVLAPHVVGLVSLRV